MYNVSDKFKEYVKNNGYIEKRAKSAKEPVAKLKWSDFELEPLKPNLIKNGWDDFEPYGNGKLIYESNFDEHWNNQFSGGATGVREANVVEKTNRLGRYDIWRTIDEFDDTGAYVTIGVKTNVKGKMRVKFGATPLVESEHEVELVADGEFHIYEFHLTELGNNNLLIGFFEEGVYELGDLRVSNNNSRHLIVEKIPLGNGLTRIQTWGGSDLTKIIFRYRSDKKRIFNTFINNHGDGVHFWDGWGVSSENTTKYLGSGEHTVVLKPDKRSADIRVLSRGNLDFIASDPVIVEGDEPNPVLIVDDLGNGKSKVRVFGANENTKLVHRSTKGIKGEPYTVKTNIDNKGNQLQLDTNLDEQSETIKKGNNDVKLEGKLKDNNIEIKLGRG